MHRLLERQLRRAKVSPTAETNALLTLIEATYEEVDQERRRQERANALLSEEVRELNAAICAEAEARVRAILDAVSDGVVMIDDDGRIDMLNAAAAQIFGLCPAWASSRRPRAARGLRVVRTAPRRCRWR